MTKKMLLILLGFLCFSSNVFSDIINTKVLKDPKTKKVIVLFGECHDPIDEHSLNQTRHVFLQFLKLNTSESYKKNETFLFFEGCSKCLKLHSEEFTQVICNNCSKERILSFEQLLRGCYQDGILRLFNRIGYKDKNLINIEARAYSWLSQYLNVKHELDLLQNDPKYKKKIEELKKLKKTWIERESYFTNDDLHLLIRLRHMILDCITKIEKIYSLTEDGIKHNIIPEIINLKSNFEDIDKKIDAICLKLQVNELVSMYSSLDISNQIVSLLAEILIRFTAILDLNCLFEILKNTDMKKGMVFAGLVHTNNIANILLKIGYEKVYDSFDNEKNKELKKICNAIFKGERILLGAFNKAIKNSDRSFSDFDYILSNNFMDSNEEIVPMKIDDLTNFTSNKGTKRKRE